MPHEIDPLRYLALSLLVGVMAASTSSAKAPRTSAPAAKPKTEASVTPPGEGMFCTLALLTTAAEVGHRCFPGQDKAFQIELDQGVARLDRFVLANSKDATNANMAKFKKEQGNVGAPAERLCGGDALTAYQLLKVKGGPFVRKWTTEAVSRPGAPTWGTCF